MFASNTKFKAYYPMTEPDFEQAKQVILKRLETELSSKLYYHSLHHTRDDVLPAIERLAQLEGIIDDEELLLLRTSALYHDVGFIEKRAGHEIVSARIAAETLPDFGYSPEQVEKIRRLIMATVMPQNPRSSLEMILADADLDILGREDFLQRSLDLRDELTALGEAIPLDEWYRDQLAFLQSHTYFTESAKVFRQDGKQRNIQKLQDLLNGSTSRLDPPVNGNNANRQIADVISKVPLFQSLPADEIQNLAFTLQPLDFSEDTILFLEGDQGDYFYIVIEGWVEVIKALGTPAEQIIATRGSGDFIGEMSLLNRDGLRTASARTKCETRLLQMTRVDFDALLTRQPHLAYELMRVLSERLNASHNHALRDMQEKNRQLSEAYQALKDAQDQLIEQEKLKRELEVAYEIQMSILPDTLPEIEGYDFGSLIVPARNVGGDFFDIVQFDEDKVGIVVGDITDKGIPAAIFMAQTHALFRSAVKPSRSPADALLEINCHLLEMNRRNLFATVLYGILDRRTGEFNYARAGHELPIIYMPDGEIVTPAMDAGMPLGLFDTLALDQQSFVLPPGSAMVLYTDGVTDALIESKNQTGEEALIDILRRTGSMSAQQVCDTIFQSLTPADQSDSLIDDVTLVAVRAHARES